MSVVLGLVRNAAELFAIPASEIIGDGRRQRAFRARAAVAWAARKHGLSTPVIGRMLGKRDHTTIINASNRAEEIRANDRIYREATDALLAGADFCCPHCGGRIA